MRLQRLFRRIKFLEKVSLRKNKISYDSTALTSLVRRKPVFVEAFIGNRKDPSMYSFTCLQESRRLLVAATVSEMNSPKSPNIEVLALLEKYRVTMNEPSSCRKLITERHF